MSIFVNRYDIIARFNGGANAGHTLVVEGKKHAFHLLPCMHQYIFVHIYIMYVAHPSGGLQ